MSASSIPFRAGETPWDADPRFNIMALYADLQSGHRAAGIHDCLLREAAPNLNLALRLWRSDMLINANSNSIYAHLQDVTRNPKLNFFWNTARIYF